MMARIFRLPPRLLASVVAVLLGATALVSTVTPSAQANRPAVDNMNSYTAHLVGARLVNTKTHVRTTLVGFGNVGMYVPVRNKTTGKVVRKWTIVKGAHFVSVHIDKYGRPYGYKVSFYQTSHGPAYVIITTPPLQHKRPIVMRPGVVSRLASHWWDPRDWGPVVSFVSNHVVKPCGNGMIDGYLSYESTLIGAQMLAAGGAITTTTVVGVSSPEMMAVGVVGTCLFGVMKGK